MKDTPLTLLLNRCLLDLERTGDMDKVLKRYPDRAAELRPLLEVASLVSEHYTVVPAPPTGLASGWSKVSEVAAEKRQLAQDRMAKAPSPKALRPQPRRSRRSHVPLTFAWKLLGAMMVVLMVFTPVSIGAVRASAQSLPGDTLYGVKLSTEELHLAYVEDDPEVKVVVALSLTSKRIGELGELVTKDRTIPAETVGRIDYLTEMALTSAAWISESVMPSMLNFIVMRTRLQVDELEMLKPFANDEQLKLLNRVQSTCLHKSQLAAIAMEFPDVFRSAYRANRPEDLLFATKVPLAPTPTPTPTLIPIPTAYPTYSWQPDLPDWEDEIVKPGRREPGDEEDLPGSTPTPQFPTTVPDGPTTGTTGGTDTTEEEDGGRKDIPPGLEDKPTLPPGQDNRPEDPGGGNDKDKDPPGQNK